MCSLNNEEKPLATPRSYDEDVEAYISFLKEGLKKYYLPEGRRRLDTKVNNKNN